MAKPKFLDDRGSIGANGSAGGAFLACPWYFGGYAIPLLDPMENHTRGTAISNACESAWTPYTDYHVKTTNTCTILVREQERWRIYIQDPELVADDIVVATAAMPDTAFPKSYSTGSDPRYSDNAAWRADSRFSPDYVSFVESPDGGLTFPIYAPMVYPGRFKGVDGCVDPLVAPVTPIGATIPAPTFPPTFAVASDVA